MYYINFPFGKKLLKSRSSQFLKNYYYFMENIFGDPSLSSTQLRQKAYTVINESERPMASCEIEQWIRNNDVELWNKVASKCKDYVRVILSQTRGKMISKFKALKPVDGIDKRSTFYGIYGRKYPGDVWVASQDKERSKKKKDDDEAYDDSMYSSIPEYSSEDEFNVKLEIKPTKKVSSFTVRESPKKVSNKERVILPHLEPIQSFNPTQMVGNISCSSVLSLLHPFNLLV